MCFIIEPKNSEVKIATRDIPCYKILRDTRKGIFSPYRKELYFEWYNTHPVIKCVEQFSYDIHCNNYIQEGLHTYSTIKMARLMNNTNCNIHKAIIPKGTKYYYNSINKEYVSIKLKVWKKNLNKK